MKIDMLKERHNRYKELFKALVYLILALLTGLVTIVYKILIHQIDPFMIIMVGIGLLIGFLLLLFGKMVWYKMEEIEEEMKNA
jgi:H+/Cl- antiporter ClcA